MPSAEKCGILLVLFAKDTSSQIVQAITLCCTAELNGLLLKTQHTLVTGYGEIKLMLTRKFLLCFVSFMVLEVQCRLLGGWKKGVFNILSSCELHYGSVDSYHHEC